MGKSSFSLDEDTAAKYKENVDNGGIELHKYDTALEKTADHNTAQVETSKVSLIGLYRFADGWDKILMCIGALAAFCHGTMVQINFIIMAEVLDIFLVELGALNSTEEEQEDVQGLLDEIPIIAVAFCSVAVSILIFGYFQMLCWVTTADRQSAVVRSTAFHAILRQHMGYFDKHPGGELNTRMTEDMATYSAGIGDKVATWIQWLSTFFMGGLICLIRGWELTLVMLLVTPVAAIVGVVIAKIQQGVSLQEMLAYSRAGGAAEEALAAVRIVAAYSGEEKEAVRYEKLLTPAQTLGIKRGFIGGVGQGIVWFIAFCIVGLAFAFGGYLYREKDYSAGFIIQVIFAMFVGMRALGWSVTSMEAISAARGAASGIWDIIDAESEIDSASQEGLRPAKCNSAITFEDIHFVYPTRRDVPILNGLSIEVYPGQTVALVGPSGCGKSTTIQLLQRYYECDKGRVLVDGHDVKDLNISWLRTQIGVVSQEPVLFATDIKTNIRFGRHDCTETEILAAAREANAHDFILKLPQGYDTVMSEMGTQLSRGQKQRIALARALIRNPKMLLLDEATSALDNESEAIVQDALDEAAKTRTTIIIAHRLSTVRNADILFIIDKGVVAEKGNHDELMAMEGLYYRLVSKQLAGAKTGEGDPPIEDKDDVISENEFDEETLDKLERTKSALSQKSIVEETKKKQEDLEDEEVAPPAMRRVFKMNSPEWPYLVCGTFCAACQGAIFPSLAILFGEVLGAFAIEDEDEQKDEINFYVCIICIVGVFAGLFTWGMVYLFGYSGEKLTLRLRVLAFRTMLSQEIGWFDDKANQVGTLTSRLANDASRVKGATGTQLMTMVNACSCALCSVIVGFIYGWQLAIVVCLFLPFLIVVGVLQTQMMSGFARSTQKAVEESGKIVSEAIDKILTVAALTKEPYFEEKFAEHFEGLRKEVRKRAHLFGVGWGVSQSLIYFAFAAAFSYGTYLVAIWVMEFADVFRVFIAVVIGGVELGRVNAVAPDISKAKVAAAKLFQLFDRPSQIDPTDPGGIKPTDSEGSVDFRKITFSYPTRPEIEVLHKFSLGVKRGGFVALVGPSGSGKSTVMQLLERFYDTHHGTVNVDGHQIKDLNLEWLRRQMAIVTQEPVLFSTTIKLNIMYGDTSRDVSMDEVVAAAKAANIHNFIASLPLGYDTHLGSKGTQLSGGQRQRVSIARALVRNPKILLLDDATSALDSESEKVVEEALANAQEGRTSIVVAHRLSTVMSADLICYVDRGEILESGTHEELMHKRGFYYKLQQMYLGNRN